VTAPIPRDFAGVVSRTVAFVVDATVVLVVVVGGAAGTRLIATVLGTGRGLAAAAMPLLLSAVPVLFVLYNFLFWGLTGRTPGMALVGLRVTGTTGRPASWASSLIRAVVFGLFPVGAAWCLVDRRHQAVHDKLARTVVVRQAPRLLVATTPVATMPAATPPAATAPAQGIRA
jgi:uncharacterized RDD family membrane protein YckC